MPKNILLVENDTALARELQTALEAGGFGVRVTGDGKEALDLAFDLSPDCIVLCVELPRMSGYSVCNKLKKDDALRNIPLVITSAEATPETFEQHRKLRTRAEDYLIKPFTPSTLVEHVAALLRVAVAPADEELVTLEDVELETTGAEDEPPVPAHVSEEDEDLRMLDSAFETLSGARRGAGEAPAAPVPPHAEAPPAMAAHAPVAPEAVAELETEMSAALDDLDVTTHDAAPPPPALAAAPPPARSWTPRPSAPAPRPVVRLVEAEAEPEHHAFEPAAEDLVVLRAELAEVRQALTERTTEVQTLRAEVSRYRDAAAGAERDTGSRDAELKAARARLEAAQGSVRRLEADLQASREGSHRAHDRATALENDLAALQARLDAELATLRARVEAAEQLATARGGEVAAAMTRAESLERVLEEARTEIEVARVEVEDVRAEEARRTADLRRHVQELEGALTRTEERLESASQRVRAEEALRERTRRALASALQMLEERPEPSAPADRPLGTQA